MEDVLCIANNYRGLGDDGEPIAECRMQTLEELRGRTGWLHDEVWDHGGEHDDWDAFMDIVESVLETGAGDAYYLWANWTVEVSPCIGDGNCVGCRCHWTELSDRYEGTTSDGRLIDEEMKRREAYEKETGKSWADREDGHVA